MTECLFCRVVEGLTPSRKVFEDEKVYAFEDIAPQAPVHILVVPRKHIPRLSDARLEAELVGELVTRAAAIARERGLSDFRLVVNDGAQAGQSVFHLHFHLLGGRAMSWPPG